MSRFELTQDKELAVVDGGGVGAILGAGALLIGATVWCADRADKIAMGFAQGYAEADAFWRKNSK